MPPSSPTPYLVDFIARNAEKPFVTNLKKYADLNEFGKLKCVSSMLTHVIIDKEQGRDVGDVLKELSRILSETIEFGPDNFLQWFEENIQ